MKVIWSPLALERLDEIFDHLVKKSPDAAEKWVRGIFHRVAWLRQLPRRCVRIGGTDKDDIRELIFDRYRIVYWVEKKAITVISIRHVRQRPVSFSIVHARDIPTPDIPPTGLIC